MLQTPYETMLDTRTVPIDLMREQSMSTMQNGHHRILIADDQPMVSILFKTVLSHYFRNITIDTVSNGKEIVERFQVQDYALVVSDLDMPVMNGEQAFTQIDTFCMATKRPMPPFVFCTSSNASSSLQKRIHNDPLLCILYKPFSNADLVAAVRCRLERS